MTESDVIQELISRMEQRKKTCFTNPNPYYVAGQSPTLYQDLNTKIKELKQLIK